MGRFCWGGVTRVLGSVGGCCFGTHSRSVVWDGVGYGIAEDLRILGRDGALSAMALEVDSTIL